MEQWLSLIPTTIRCYIQAHTPKQVAMETIFNLLILVTLSLLVAIIIILLHAYIISILTIIPLIARG